MTLTLRERNEIAVAISFAGETYECETCHEDRYVGPQGGVVYYFNHGGKRDEITPKTFAVAWCRSCRGVLRAFNLPLPEEGTDYWKAWAYRPGGSGAPDLWCIEIDEAVTTYRYDDGRVDDVAVDRAGLT